MKNLTFTYKDAAKYTTITFLVGSLMVGIIFHFGHSAFIPSGERPRLERDFSVWASVIGFLGTYIYLFILFAINLKILESKKTDRKKIGIAILSTITIVFCCNYITSLFMQAVINVDHIPLSARIGPLIKDFVLAIIVLSFSLIIYLSSQKQKMGLDYEAMKAENARSRFEALKNQLDPHFLFNTFNALDSLIQEDPERARNYLQQLSSVFRYVISNKESTTLENELKFTNSYNELMQLRYENSLVFDFNIDKQYLHYQIVPLSIQTLIENAIKHNVLSSESPLMITITVGPNPIVTVSNDMRPKKNPQSGSGIGLSNLTERFWLKLQKEIIISDKEGIFTVILPLQNPNDNISQTIPSNI
jgi:two-component system, LytTR family, sensor kinase